MVVDSVDVPKHVAARHFGVGRRAKSGRNTTQIDESGPTFEVEQVSCAVFGGSRRLCVKSPVRYNVTVLPFVDTRADTRW